MKSEGFHIINVIYKNIRNVIDIVSENIIDGVSKTASIVIFSKCEMRQ